MILGAAVADAAALGLHWIYSQPRVRRAGGDAPEFAEPDPANYEGVPSYFAHGGRRAGDGSMYGEGLLTTLRSVVANGRFDYQHYAGAFEAHFGFGGEYVGYIDTPTRETLTNMLVRRRAVHELAMGTPFAGSEKEKRAVVGKVLAAAEQTHGDDLRASVEEALRAAEATEAQIDLSRHMIDRIEESRDFPGADDVQLPAITKVPVLAATDADDRAVEEAVRMTNNNDRAVAWAHFIARLMRWSLRDEANIEGLEGAIRSALNGSPDYIVAAVETVLKQKQSDNKAVTMK
ncbi:MAG: ADP-ribosylglycohydrolase family protein, partial [Spirochaetales bacterium]|nr:ADP-ribosylglycohydrolase family protein [Spirochaetales bacterium]